MPVQAAQQENQVLNQIWWYKQSNVLCKDMKME